MSVGMAGHVALSTAPGTQNPEPGTRNPPQTLAAATLLDTTRFRPSAFA